MDESGQSGKKTLRVEGRGCVFVRQVVCGYPPETKARVSYKGVHQIGGTPVPIDGRTPAWRQRFPKARDVYWLPWSE